MAIYIPQEKLVQATLCLLVQGDPPGKVLLGLKKHGFGQGKYGGFGGKVDAGESIEAAALREMEEETGICVAPEDLCYVAKLTFLFPLKEAWNQEVHVYMVETCLAQPTESDEMLPAWFALDEIPYAQMWDDATYWLPFLLAGRRIQAKFIFAADNERVREVQVSDWPGDDEEGD